MALVIQPLLVDTHGEVEPAKIVTDVQFRMFQKQPEQGAVEKTQVGVYEVRRRLLRDGASGFLAQDGEDATAYLPRRAMITVSLRRTVMNRGAPLVVKQRTRCTMCHGEDLTGLMTFAMAVPPKERPGPRCGN